MRRFRWNAGSHVQEKAWWLSAEGGRKVTSGSEQSVVLTNGLIRLGVARASGKVVELTDLRSGHNYVERPSMGRLFRLIAPEADFPGRSSDAHLAPSVEVTIDQGTQELRLYYCDLKDCRGGPLAVQATAYLRLVDDTVVCRLELVGLSSQPLPEVFFPWLGGLGPAEDAESDVITMPSTWQRTVQRPLRTLPDRRLGWNKSAAKRSWRYPVNLVTAWTSYGGANRGLALDVRGTSCEPQDIYIERQWEPTPGGIRAGSLALAWVFHPHHGNDGSWQSPEVQLHLHEGDWHVPARRHRTWALQHFRPAATPSHYLASIGWQFLIMRHEDGQVNWTYRDLPGVARRCVASGLPNLLIFGWFEGGHDALFPEYKPVEAWGGAEALREAIAQMRADGANPILYMNPTIWDCRTEAYQRYGARWSAKSRAGSEYRESYAWTNTEASTTDRSKSFAVMCPTPGLNAFTLDTVARIAGYGGPSLHFDQMVRAFCCYDPDHGHAAPQRAAIDGYAQFLPEVRELLQRANPGAILSLEGMSEFHCRFGDSCWNWSQLSQCEPIRVSMPLTPYSHELEAGETADVNRCFVKGLMMDFRTDGGDGLVADYPRFAAHVRRVADLKRRVAPWLGRCLFEDTLGLTLVGEHLCGATYAAEDGSYAAAVIAGTASRPTAVTCQVDWPALAPGASSVWRYGLDGTTVTACLTDKIDEVWEPYHVEVWVAS